MSDYDHWRRVAMRAALGHLRHGAGWMSVALRQLRSDISRAYAEAEGSDLPFDDSTDAPWDPGQPRPLPIVVDPSDCYGCPFEMDLFDCQARLALGLSGGLAWDGVKLRPDPREGWTCPIVGNGVRVVAGEGMGQ